MKDWWQATFPKGRQTITITDACGQPVTISYGEKGTGKPLFLVHGVASWSYNWRNAIEPLAQHFRVICFDAKGHGYSDKPLHSEILGHQAVELERIVRALCDEPAIVVAQSLGALVTLATAEAHPELFAGLVVINVPIFLKRLPFWGMQLLADLPLDWVRIVDNLRLTQVFAPLVRLLMGVGRLEVVVDPAQITLEEVYWITYPYIEFPNTLTKTAEDLQHAASEIQRLVQNQPNLIREVQDNLSAIAAPTLILWGAQDRWFPATDGETLHAHLPNSKFQIIPNCGHDAAGTCADAISAAIVDFFSNTALLAPTDLSDLSK